MLSLYIIGRQQIYNSFRYGVTLKLLTATLLTGCGGPAAQRDPATITVEEATEVLRQVQAAAKDVDTLCLVTDKHVQSRCKDDWILYGGAAAVPDEPPTIVTTYVLPERTLANGDRTLGGRMLVLEGNDNLGRHYCTDFLVFPSRNSNDLVAYYPVYWSGAGIARSYPDGTIDDAVQLKRPCDP